MERRKEGREGRREGGGGEEGGRERAKPRSLQRKWTHSMDLISKTTDNVRKTRKFTAVFTDSLMSNSAFYSKM